MGINYPFKSVLHMTMPPCGSQSSHNAINKMGFSVPNVMSVDYTQRDDDCQPGWSVMLLYQIKQSDKRGERSHVDQSSFVCQVV